jgi:enoyl-CoA hydratase/carnithine racemase
MSLQCERDENTGVVTLRLDRPARMNALTFEVYDELRSAFRRLSDEEGVRVNSRRPL